MSRPLIQARAFLRPSLPLLLLASLVLALLIWPSRAPAAGGTDPMSMTINDNALATPYPATVTVSNVRHSVHFVEVEFLGFAHPSPSDVNALLVGPTGKSVVLMADDCAGSPPFTTLNLIFTDYSFEPLPKGNTCPTGGERGYQPSSYNSSAMWPSPAPAPPYGSKMSVFNDQDPNGTWKLYIFDDSTGGSGSIYAWHLEVRLRTGNTGGGSDVPDTLLSKHPDKQTHSEEARFRFHATVAHSTFRCNLDHNPFRRCASPRTVTVSPGEHRFEVEGVDWAGHDVTPAIYKWKVLP